MPTIPLLAELFSFFYFKFRHYDSESCLFRFFVHFSAAAMHSTIIAYYCRDSAVRHVNIRSSLRLSAHQRNCGAHAGRIRLARLTNSITDRPVYRRLTAMVRLSSRLWLQFRMRPASTCALRWRMFTVYVCLRIKMDRNKPVKKKRRIMQQFRTEYSAQYPIIR